MDLSNIPLIQLCRELSRNIAREMGVGFPEKMGLGDIWPMWAPVHPQWAWLCRPWVGVWVRGPLMAGEFSSQASCYWLLAPGSWLEDVLTHFHSMSIWQSGSAQKTNDDHYTGHPVAELTGVHSFSGPAGLFREWVHLLCDFQSAAAKGRE